jgi:hypothetical protein
MNNEQCPRLCPRAGGIAAAPRYGGPGKCQNVLAAAGIVKYKKCVYPSKFAVHPRGEGNSPRQGDIRGGPERVQFPPSGVGG